MLTGWRKTVSKCFLIPQRYIIGLMGFFAVINAYTMRVCLNVAITEMRASASSKIATNGTHMRRMDDEVYDWNKDIESLILGSFYWGYVVTHMPGGILAERFGGKYTLGLGMLSTALFTIITPWVVRAGDYPWLIAVRVLEGLGEGTTYPALSCLLSRWVPVQERGKIGTLVYAGGQIGTVVGNAATGALIDSTGTWATPFYVFGSVGVLWFIVWVLLCYSDPDSHPFITEKEHEFLRKELGEKEKEPLAIPWLALLTSVPIWALVTAQIGHDWGFFTMVTNLPKFMKEVLGFDVKENGIWSSVPYILMWIVSMGSGWLCDWLTSKNYMSLTFARKFFTAIAAVGPACFIVGAGYVGNDQTLAITLFTVAMGFMGTFYCGMKVNALDLAPNFAGTIMAIVNGLAAITGIITPEVVSKLTSEHSTAEEWQVVFWISFAVFIITTIIYVWFGSADVQAWNSPHAVATVPVTGKGAKSDIGEGRTESV